MSIAKRFTYGAAAVALTTGMVLTAGAASAAPTGIHKGGSGLHKGGSGLHKGGSGIHKGGSGLQAGGKSVAGHEGARPTGIHKGEWKCSHKGSKVRCHLKHAWFGVTFHKNHTATIYDHFKNGRSTGLVLENQEDNHRSVVATTKGHTHRTVKVGKPYNPVKVCSNHGHGKCVSTHH